MGRKDNVERFYCKECKKDLSKANRASHFKTRKHLNNIPLESETGGDIQQVSGKIVNYLPKFLKTKHGELHLPSHNFTGPLTRLDLRLDENDKPLPDSIPINKIDEAAMKHDIAYRSEDLRDRHLADVDLIHDLNEIKKPTIRERLERALVKTIMKGKIAIGQGHSKPPVSYDEATELHKEYRKPKKFLKVKVFNKDDIWSADLVFMPTDSGYKIILTIIDVYTRYAWCIPLKDKSGESIKQAFVTLFEQDPLRIPNKLWTDDGTEFKNKIFRKLLEENEIELYHTFNEGKAVMIERFNRTLKNLMWKEFTVQGNQKWVDILPKLVDFYNNKIHRSIGVSPHDTSIDPSIIKEQTNEEHTKEKPKYKVLDRVRIFKYRYHFDKKYTASWTREKFIIKTVNKTDPITYSLLDSDGEDIL